MSPSLRMCVDFFSSSVLSRHVFKDKSESCHVKIQEEGEGEVPALYVFEVKKAKAFLGTAWSVQVSWILLATRGTRKETTEFHERLRPIVI